jgi:hypothetical protein
VIENKGKSQMPLPASGDFDEDKILNLNWLNFQLGVRAKNEEINDTQGYPEKLLKTQGNPKCLCADPAILMNDIDENRGHDLSDNKGMTSASR